MGSPVPTRYGSELIPPSDPRARIEWEARNRVTQEFGGIGGILKNS